MTVAGEFQFVGDRVGVTENLEGTDVSRAEFFAFVSLSEIPGG